MTPSNGQTAGPTIHDDDMPILAAAIGYAGHGLKVVPLHHTLLNGDCDCGSSDCAKSERSRGKHPIESNWPDRATTDVRVIEQKWRRYPDANVGVQLGPNSGVVDFECDSKKAEQTLLALFRFDVPVTPMYGALRGDHRLFKFRADLPRKSNIKIGGLEIRTGWGEPKQGKKESGQQSVFPPSVRHLTDGTVVNYAWRPGLSLEDVDPQEIPDDVLARICNLDGEDEIPTNDHKPDSVPLDTLRDALEHLNPKRLDDYQNGGWINVGMTLFDATRGSEEGLQLWDVASQKSLKYKAEVCAAKWKTFDSNRPDGKRLTVGSLFWWARLDSGWRPPKRTPAGSYSFLTNSDPDEKGNWKFPRAMPDILADVFRLANGWPRRVNAGLFIPAEDGITWLDSTEAVFGWLGSITPTPPRFAKSPAMHTRGDVFAELRRTATAYRAVETLPHEPPMTGHYYACDPPDAGNGDRLRWLLNRFNTETETDRDLIQAALMTCLWGGPGGCRPAFVLTADAGRGVGKSKGVAMISEVIGGHIELSANEDPGIIRQRLLSPEGLSKRLALLDNVKSMRFSWAELEAMITAGIISGKRMYVGEGQRPNTLCWFITLNGVSLSKDLAQRSVIIKLKKPTFDPLWEEQTRAYIREHRREIIGDIVAALRTERTDLESYSRWGAWERDVLSRLPEPAEAQAVIAERQAMADVDSEEAGIIEQAFRQRLTNLGYDPDRERIFIPSETAAKWLSDAVNDRVGTTASTRRLGQFIDEGAFQNLAKSPSRTHGRGFNWRGQESSPSGPVLADIEQRIAEQEQRRFQDT